MISLRKVFLGLAVVFFLLFGLSAAGASEIAVLEAEKLLNIGGKEALLQAHGILDRLLEAEPADSRLLCLYAEVSFSYGDWLAKDEQIELWEKALRQAEKAAELEPTSPHGHYWAAALMGKIGRAKGILQSLFLMNPMLERLEHVLELDPDYSWAYYVLSQMYQEMPPKPVGRGDRKKALSYAERAWELEPEEGEFSLLYAELLVKNKKPAAAAAVLKASLEEPTYDWDERVRREAEKLYQSLENVS